MLDQRLIRVRGIHFFAWFEDCWPENEPIYGFYWRVREREREGSCMVEERERGPSENEGKALGFDSFT